HKSPVRLVVTSAVVADDDLSDAAAARQVLEQMTDDEAEAFCQQNVRHVLNATMNAIATAEGSILHELYTSRGGKQGAAAYLYERRNAAVARHSHSSVELL